MLVTLTCQVGLKTYFEKHLYRTCVTVVLAGSLTPVKVFLAFKPLQII